MINLPKPSPISAKGNANDKCNYFFNYLTKLVYELEKILAGTKSNNNKNKKTVDEISLNNNKLIITYSDGTIKTLDI